jgi:phthiocerol/phenolphthiocerol synthesis type-I polyketide synthase A
LKSSPSLIAEHSIGKLSAKTMKDQVVINLHNPVIRDHQVYGRHLFPGLAYVDLIHQLFRESDHGYADTILRNLAIHHPLLVEDGCEVLLNVDMTPDEASWHVVVEGELRRSGTLTGDKKCYATAEICRTTPSLFEDTLDLEVIKQSAGRVIDTDEIYESYRTRGLLHQGLMKVRGKVYVSGIALYADLCLSEEALGTAGSLMFHPALLDGSAVVAGGALIDENAEPLRVPLSFESFRASELLGKRCLTRVLLASLRKTKDLSFLTMEVFDESGRKMGEMKDLACQVIREKAMPGGRNGRPQPTNGPPAQAVQIVSDTIPGVLSEGGKSAVETEMFLRQVLAKKLGTSPQQIHPRRTFAAMGLTSADLLSLVREIEIWTATKLPPTLLFEYTTVAELSSYLAGPCRLEAEQQLADSDLSDLDGRTSRMAPPAIATAGSNSDLLPREGIAIIGMSGCFPQAETLDKLWENLKSGKDCITEIPPDRWDKDQYFDPEPGKAGKTRCKWGGFIEGVDEFDPLFYNISPRDAELMDPQVRRFLETVWTLLEGAGHTRDQLRARYKGKVGVYVGCMYQHYNAPDHDPVADSVRSLSSYGAIANRVSHFFGLQGPSIAVDTMCSSSATAIHLACSGLTQGDCELAIAGGVNLSIDPRKYVGLSLAQLIASSPNSRSFGQGDGYLPAEAVGAVLLKPVHRAIEDGDSILAVIKATAINHVGSSTAYSVPNPSAQVDVIEKTLADARVDARMLSYVEASATGSASADLIEVEALRKVFSKVTKNQQFCGIGSVKSNLGHAEAASGITQLAKVIVQLQHGLLPPSINPGPLNSGLCLEETPFYLPQQVQEWKRLRLTINSREQDVPRLALINSFGAGGAYASLLIEEYVPLEPQPAVRAMSVSQPQIVVFSARTRERLSAVLGQLLDYVEIHEDLSLLDFAYTLQTGREAMESRLAIVVSSREELIQAMRKYVPEKSEDSSNEMDNPAFAGEFDNGSQIGELSSGRVGEVITRALLEERNFPKIALLWTQGAEICWELLHSGFRPQKLSLPTYPFSRGRYWIKMVNPSFKHCDSPEVGNPSADVKEASDPLRYQIQNFITKFLAEALNIPEQQIHAKRSLQAYGFDSIVGMRLARALEQRFATPVTGRVLFEHRTVDSLSAYLESKATRSNAGAAAGVGEDSALAENGQPESTAADRAIDALEQFKSGRLSRNDLEAFIEQSVLV